jgi:hypothetical protein
MSSAFDDFEKVHGKGIKCRPVADETIEKYKDVLPAPLLDYWRQAGWCGYSDGLLWLVNPEELRDPFVEWLGPDAENSYPIVRTALGDIIFWNDKGAFYLDIREEEVKKVGENLEVLFFYTLCDDGYLDHVIDRNIFRKVFPRLGVLEHDECYAFTPAVQLGGPGTADTLQRAKLREYLSILAQLR